MQEEAGFAHESAALFGDRRSGVGGVPVFEGKEVSVSAEVGEDEVFAIRLEHSASVNGVDGDEVVIRNGFVDGGFQPSWCSGGDVAVSSHFLATVSSDGNESAGLPRDHPVALHFEGLGAGLVDAERFSIEEEFDFFGVGVGLHGNEGSERNLVMGPVRKDVNHGLAGPLTLVEVEEVFSKAGEVVGASGKGVEGPTAVDIGRFSGVIETGPAKGACDPRKVAHFFPVLASADADGAVVVGGIEKLLAIGHGLGGEEGVGEDFFLGEVGDEKWLLPLVRVAVAIPGFRFVESAHLPSVGRFGGNEGAVKGAGFIEGFFLGTAVDSNDVHLVAAGISGGDRTGTV